MSRRYRPCSLHIGNYVIENTQQWLHLGHRLFTSELSDHADVANRRNCCIDQVNNLRCQFSVRDSMALKRVFTSCCGSHNIMIVSCGTCNVLQLMITVRHTSSIWRLPRDSHCKMIALIANCLPLFEAICLSFLNFITACADSDSHIVRFYHMARCSAASVRFSPIGKNFCFCADRFRFTSEDLNLLTRPGITADRYYQAHS
jgi:hypothetical protein